MQFVVSQTEAFCIVDRNAIGIARNTALYSYIYHPMCVPETFTTSKVVKKIGDALA